MLTLGMAFYQLKNELSGLYDDREAAAISHEVLEHVSGLTRANRLTEKDRVFTDKEAADFARMTAELKKGKPLQYVVGVAWFLGRPYEVNEHVLIPRPETEELVAWAIADHRGKEPLNILDIGTGTGCIPIALKLALPAADVTSCDISTKALEVARSNAATYAAEVRLLEMDILNEQRWAELQTYDVIISNPPYIPLARKKEMHVNVVNFEPAGALFVPNNDPLVFYRAIAHLGHTHLAAGGTIYCETEELQGQHCRELFLAESYSQVEIKKDMHGNWRMLKAQR